MQHGGVGEDPSRVKGGLSMGGGVGDESWRRSCGDEGVES